MKLKRLAICAAAGILSPGCSSAADDQSGASGVPIYGIWDMESQRLTGPKEVTTSDPGFGSDTIIVTVDTDGTVAAARFSDNDYQPHTPEALAAARQWTFHPFTFEGKPVRAIGPIRINLKPPVEPAAPAPFPDATLAETQITLSRSACFGTCPDYSVTITGDGLVRFSTRQWADPETAAAVHRQFNDGSVLWPGEHQARVAPEKVAALVERFREANFYGLKDEYSYSATDNPTYVLRIARGGKVKEVTDYVGLQAGMPASVTELEDAVDELAGVERWTRGNAGTIELLKQQGFDFGSSAVADLVLAGWQLGYLDDSRVDAMIDAVLKQDVDLSVRSEKGERLGTILTRYAIDKGNADLFARMRDAGQLQHLNRAQLRESLEDGAGCNPEIARALVKAGARFRSGEASPLGNIDDSYGPCQGVDSAGRVAFGKALIDLGAPLEARSSINWTPLMGVIDPAIARMLIDAGADVNARSKDGDAPVSTTMDDRTAIMLLRAGATAKGKFDGKTLREIAESRPWPATLAWLDAHGID